MIRFLIFIALLCWGLRWLSELTALPDARPLDTSELPRLLRQKPTRSGTPSLTEAFALAVQKMEHSSSSAAMPASKLSGLPTEGLSPELIQEIREASPDMTRMADLVLRDAEALPHDNLQARAEDRLRLLQFSLGATEGIDPARDNSSAIWLNVGLRQLEIPTGPDARDPSELEVVRDAATLVLRFTPDAAKRSRYYRRLEALHPSPVLQGELQRVLLPGPAGGVR